MAFVPINQELHANKHWVRHTSIGFAKDDVVAPLFANELVDALESMPIAFIKHGERFVLVVLMGFKHGENLFVSDREQWLSDYMPVIYRSSPFDLRSVEGNDDQYILCIDESRITETDQGQPFFDEAGALDPEVAKIFQLIQQFNANRKLTDLICAELARHNLIVPWPITFLDGEAQVNVGGLYQIDQAALNALPDDDFLSLRKAHALPVAYTQLLSMRKIALLHTLQGQRNTAKENKSPVAETFNFAGLS